MPIIVDESKLSEVEDWFVVDIGYSGKSKSCGVYTSEMESGYDIQYGELLDRIVEFLNNKQEICLIIEAPLSISFSLNGNPKGRIPEKVGTTTRYWYYGAAATVSMATLELLYNLKNEKKKIYLFEGMVTFKEKMNNNKKPFHWEDAKAIFNSAKKVVEGKNKNLLLSKDLFDKNTENRFIGTYLDLNNKIPPVIKVD